MILWLEDRRDTVLSFESALKERGLAYHMLSSINEVDQFLKEQADLNRLCFVIDIMLHGVDDLNSIGVYNAPTVSGSRAGQVFVERYLRADGSRFAGSPVIFLTERLVDEGLKHEVSGLSRPGTGPVHIYKKYIQAECDAFVATVETYANDSRA